MKIPENAKKVFEGIIFDVYQWQQEMFDGSYETFEMLKRSNTIEVIAISRDKVILSHQSQPNKDNYYSLLGGRAEKDEEPLVTAKRELLEEAGLESLDWELFKVYEPAHKIDWKVYTYIARNCTKKSEPKLDPGEKIEIIELDFEKFLDITGSEEYLGNELALDIFRIRQDKTKLDSFKKKLFKRVD